MICVPWEKTHQRFIEMRVHFTRSAVWDETCTKAEQKIEKENEGEEEEEENYDNINEHTKVHMRHSYSYCLYRP